jgi:putative iron-regulated protein
MIVMKRATKIWTGLGIAAVAGTLQSHAGDLDKAVEASPLLLAQAAGEGGEGGGEGAGTVTSTYALNSTDPKAFNYDAQPQIGAYVNLVERSYKDSVAGAEALAKSVDALLAVPSEESLAAARKAWIDARPAYLKTEAFRFYDGPIDAREGNINAWPMNEAFIDYVEGDLKAGLINDRDAKLDVEALADLNQKDDDKNVTTGWHAIEFLLWGQDLSATGPGNRPYTDFVVGEDNNDRRRIFLKLTTDRLVKDLDAVLEGWESDEKGNYREKFLGLPPREALGRMVNGMAILAGFEFMSERLAVALDSGDQEDEHSCFSDTTKQDFIYDLAGIKQVWTGAKLNELVASQDKALADRIDSFFADAETKVNALGDPWDKVLATPKGSAERKAAEDLVTALQNLGSGMTDVGKKLGVLVLIPTG